MNPNGTVLKLLLLLVESLCVVFASWDSIKTDDGIFFFSQSIQAILEQNRQIGYYFPYENFNIESAEIIDFTLDESLPMISQNSCIYSKETHDIVCVGGYSGERSIDVIAYNIVKRTWQSKYFPSLPARWGISTFYSSKGHIYSYGGYSDSEYIYKNVSDQIPEGIYLTHVPNGRATYNVIFNGQSLDDFIPIVNQSGIFIQENSFGIDPTMRPTLVENQVGEISIDISIQGLLGSNPFNSSTLKSEVRNVNAGGAEIQRIDSALVQIDILESVDSREIPHARSYACMLETKSNTVTVLFGEKMRNSDGTTEYFDDVWEANIDADFVSWDKRARNSVHKPSPRSKFGCDTFRDGIVIFGGKVKEGDREFDGNDIWILEDDEWSQLFSAPPTSRLNDVIPYPSDTLTMSIVGTIMIVFQKNATEIGPSLFYFDLCQKNWILQPDRLNGLRTSCEEGSFHVVFWSVLGGVLTLLVGLALLVYKVKTKRKSPSKAILEMENKPQDEHIPEDNGDYILSELERASNFINDNVDNQETTIVADASHLTIPPSSWTEIKPAALLEHSTPQVPLVPFTRGRVVEIVESTQDVAIEGVVPTIQ